MKKITKILSIVLCLAMVLSFATAAFAQDEQTFTKVTDVSELAVGDQIILVADEEDLALSTTQNKNNRGAAAITRNGDVATITADVQVLTLEAGSVEGTFAFNTGSGYLYAASSSKNYLRTEDALSANSSWLITIADGITSVVAQGENARNVLQYNPNNGAPLFSCYDSAKMSALSIYKLDTDAPVEPETPVEPEVPAPTTVTIVEANTIGAAMEHNTFTEEKYIVTGVIVEIKSTTYGNMYIEDAEGNRLYIYGVYNADGTVRFDEMDPQPAVGDTITLVGVLGQYNGNAQMKNGWTMELVPGEKEEEPETPVEPEEPVIPDPTTVTIVEANTIGAAMEHNTFTEEKYIVTGVIVEIKSTTYGNMYIEDAEGNRLYIYGVYNADGTVRFDEMDPQPAVGDTITLVGVLGQYNGNAQMKNGWTMELVPGEKEEEPETPDVPVEPEEPETPAATTVTIEEAIAIGAAKEHNTFTEEMYIVTGVIVEITNDTWGNLYIEDANGNRLFLYGLYSADGSIRYDAMENKPAVGDTITVVGVLGQYNGTPQMKNAWLCEVPSDTGDSIVAIVSAMLISGMALVALPKKREF